MVSTKCKNELTETEPQKEILSSPVYFFSPGHIQHLGFPVVQDSPSFALWLHFFMLALKPSREMFSTLLESSWPAFGTLQSSGICHFITFGSEAQEDIKDGCTVLGWEMGKCGVWRSHPLSSEAREEGLG